MTGGSGARTTPYGAWSSPISTELLVAGAVGLHEVQADGEDLWWDEGRPAEGGRVQLVRRSPDGATTDVLPDDYAARTRVHEYGGGAWRVHDGTVYFSNWSDQRLHRLDPGGEPVPLTPEGCRYADMDIAPDGAWLVAVREDHRGAGEAKNEIVRIDTTTGEETVLVTGPDFVASPRVMEHGGMNLAWTQWNHPDMPWDAAEVWVAEIGDDLGLQQIEQLGGGSGVWASHPTWAPDGTLWLTSDHLPWWADGSGTMHTSDGGGAPAPVREGVPRYACLYRWDGGELESVDTHPDGDIASPPWVFRMSTFVAGGTPGRDEPRGWVVVRRSGKDDLVHVDPFGARAVDIPTPYTAWSCLGPTPAGFVAVAASLHERTGDRLGHPGRTTRCRDRRRPAAT